ncbi:MAG TPA: diguanylate cyclase [Blastocatellia bacterium]|nr:diguanylate cyclase [Blastocatellia bacterium]
MIRLLIIEQMPLDAPTISDRNPAAEPSHQYTAWLKAQGALAASTNLALVTISGNNEVVGAASNDTSICEAWLADPEKSRQCAEFCGRAREKALAAGETITYRCHAGLHCFATPIHIEGLCESPVILGGRAFVSTRDYREFIGREQHNGTKPDPAISRNLKFTDEEELKRAARFISSRAREILGQAQMPGHQDSAALHLVTSAKVTKLESRQSSSVIKAPAAFFNSPFDQGCREALRTLSLRYGISSMALLMRRGEDLAACAASGPQRQRLINARVNSDDSLLARLRAQSGRPGALTLSDYEIAFLLDDDDLPVAEIGSAFPLFIGAELHGALLALDARLDAETRRQILEFGQSIIVPLEMASLRNQLSEYAQAGAELRDFASRITTLSEPSEIYAEVLRKSIEVLGAERASLMTFDEQSQSLTFRGSFGLSEEILQTERPRPGEGIAGAVFESGEPLLVRDITELEVAEDKRWIAERIRARYSRSNHSRSFISFPIQIGQRRIGVLNLSGTGYGPGDLRWLRGVIPHAAAALDRIHLREQAERFQLMSITDSLTGLLNRRYLEERFSEELKRSQRYYYPLSLLMIDIDRFKSYNDSFGHQAGDEVLHAVAQCIRGALRNFDVAARYGGEEFCIILPETDVTAAAVLAERLRAQVEADFGPANPQVRRPLTISIGVASLSHNLHTTEQITKAADQALYAAKNQGRNCVVVSGNATD